MTRSLPSVITQILFLFSAYFLFAKLAMLIHTVGGFAALVWPPTGIAIAALFLYGNRLWPAIFFGAFLANLSAGAPWTAALGIGVGNSLEAIFAATLLRRSRFRPSFDGLDDVFKLLCFAAILSSVISSSIGIFSLWAGGAMPGNLIAKAGVSWWFGDAMGALVVSPFLVVWLNRNRPQYSRKIFEAAALTLIAAMVGVGAFVDPPFSAARVLYFHPYMVFPIMLWAAVRFRQHGATFVAVMISVFAIWGTLNGGGPFVGVHTSVDLSDALLRLQTFMTVVILTGLVLSAIVNERERDLQSLRDEREVRERFVAMLSHDLRSPLTAAKTSAEILLRGDPLSDAQERHATRITSSINRADHMIQDLLDANRIHAGQKIPLQLVACDLKRIVSETLEDLGVVHGNRFVANFPSNCEGFWCPVELRRVIENLASNAIKYGKSDEPVTIGVDAVGDSITLSVHNHGRPLSLEEQRTIFEPFRRSQSADRSKERGWGLGLTLARGIVEAHGGTISVRSLLNEGTTFTVKIPRDARAFQTLGDFEGLSSNNSNSTSSPAKGEWKLQSPSP